MSEGHSFSYADRRAGVYCYGTDQVALTLRQAISAEQSEAQLSGESGAFAARGECVGDVRFEALCPAVTAAGQRLWLCAVRGAGPRGEDIDGWGVVTLGPAGLAGAQLRRSLWVCFDGELAITALAERRRAGDGHGDEALTAFVARGAPLAASIVGDPRLSSSYGADGRLLRAGLELWDDADDGGRERSAALRLAGEALVTGELRAVDGGGRTDVAFLVWHHRGREGIGCYAIERAT